MSNIRHLLLSLLVKAYVFNGVQLSLRYCEAQKWFFVEYASAGIYSELWKHFWTHFLRQAFSNVRC